MLTRTAPEPNAPAHLQVTHASETADATPRGSKERGGASKVIARRPRGSAAAAERRLRLRLRTGACEMMWELVVVVSVGTALLLLLLLLACRIWKRNRYYKKVQHSLDEEERAFQE